MVRCCTFLLVVLDQHPQYYGIYMMFLLNTMVFMFGSTRKILQWISVSWFNGYPWIPQNLVTERKPIVSGGQTMWYPDIPHFETNPYDMYTIHTYIYIYTYLHLAIVAPVSSFDGLCSQVICRSLHVVPTTWFSWVEHPQLPCWPDVPVYWQSSCSHILRPCLYFMISLFWGCIPMSFDTGYLIYLILLSQK